MHRNDKIEGARRVGCYRRTEDGSRNPTPSTHPHHNAHETPNRRFGPKGVMESSCEPEDETSPSQLNNPLRGSHTGQAVVESTAYDDNARDDAFTTINPYYQRQLQVRHQGELCAHTRTLPLRRTHVGRCASKAPLPCGFVVRESLRILFQQATIEVLLLYWVVCAARRDYVARASYAFLCAYLNRASDLKFQRVGRRWVRLCKQNLEVITARIGIRQRMCSLIPVELLSYLEPSSDRRNLRK